MITTDLCIFVEKNSLEEFRYRDQCFLIFKNLSKAKQYFMTLQNHKTQLLSGSAITHCSHID